MTSDPSPAAPLAFQPRHAAAPDPRADAAAVLRALRRRWLVLVGAAVVAAVLVAARELSLPRTYTSTGTFIVQGGRSTPSLSGIASQFGIALPAGTDAGASPALYAQILQSRTVLDSVAAASYCEPCGPGRPMVPLVRLLGAEARDPRLAVEEVGRRLQKQIGGAVDQKTGIVTVAATARSPELAQQMAQRALDATVRFNLEARQSQSGAERRFTEARLSDVAAELRAAEQRLRDFRESNRFTGLSPELQLREAQLQREVTRYEEVYSALARTLEQSKIDELRDTPTVLVLDPPALPFEPNGRGLVFKAIFGALLGGAVAAAVIGALAMRRRAA